MFGAPRSNHLMRRVELPKHGLRTASSWELPWTLPYLTSFVHQTGWNSMVKPQKWVESTSVSLLTPFSSLKCALHPQANKVLVSASKLSTAQLSQVGLSFNFHDSKLCILQQRDGPLHYVSTNQVWNSWVFVEFYVNFCDLNICKPSVRSIQEFLVNATGTNSSYINTFFNFGDYWCDSLKGA